MQYLPQECTKLKETPMQYLSWEKTCFKINEAVVRSEVDEVMAIAKVMGDGEGKANQLLVRYQ
jgi:hypothetical protein